MNYELVGHRGDDVRHAQLQAAIYGAAGGKKQGGGRITMEDFTIDYWQAEEERIKKQQQEMKHRLLGLAAMQNAYIDQQDSKNG